MAFILNRTPKLPGEHTRPACGFPRPRGKQRTYKKGPSDFKAFARKVAARVVRPATPEARCVLQLRSSGLNQCPGLNAKGVLSFSPGLRASATLGAPPVGPNPERVASVPHSSTRFLFPLRARQNRPEKPQPDRPGQRLYQAQRAKDNSPAIDRWVGAIQRDQSRQGRKNQRLRPHTPGTSLRTAAVSCKSPEPTAVGAVSSAVAVHGASLRGLSLFRSALT